MACQIIRGDPSGADALGALEASLAVIGDAVHAREQVLRREGAQRAFEGQLAAAFKMAPDEPRTLDVVRRAFTAVDPDATAEILLADSSHAHLRRAAASDVVGAEPLCTVESPLACPSATSGHPLAFADSGALDACPYLHERAGVRCAAACFPVALAGRTVGVLHARFDAAGLPPEPTLDRFRAIAHETGTRLAMLRALSASELAAATDPLTGLLNRRSLESAYVRVTRDRPEVTVLMADLDHFKRLNDTFGHETGDRVLRTFAQSLTAAVRAGDLVARHGGEEFVLVLPSAPLDASLRVIAAIRRKVRARVSAGSLPSFTASFGVASALAETPLEELLRAADVALYEAKQAGRNRTVASGRGVVEEGSAEDEPPTARLVGG